MVFTDENGNKKDMSIHDFKTLFASNHPDLVKFFDDPELLLSQEGLLEKAQFWWKACKKIVQHMWKIRGCFIFHAPVDMEKYDFSFHHFDFV